jgi:hypothetical protein
MTLSKPTSPKRREVTFRFPDQLSMKETPNKALLSIRLKYGEGIPRKRILEIHVVSKGVFDRSIQAFKNDRSPGKEGKPTSLSIEEEGMFVTLLDRYIASGRYPTFSDMTHMVFLFSIHLTSSI